MRRAEIQSNIFLYIAGAILVVLLLIFGFKAIMGLWGKERLATVIGLAANLETAVDAVSEDFGSSRDANLRVPDNVDTVCFVDLNHSDYIAKTHLASSYPEINQSVMAGARENMFLIAQGKVTDSRHIGELCFGRPYYRCIETPNGILRMLIEGRKGDFINCQISPFCSWR